MRHSQRNSKLTPHEDRDLFPDYNHLDVFIGKNAARDVVPLILKELDQ